MECEELSSDRVEVDKGSVHREMIVDLRAAIWMSAM